MLRRYFSAPNSALSTHRMGFLIYGTLFGDSGMRVLREAFHALMSSSLSFTFGFWE